MKLLSSMQLSDAISLATEHLSLKTVEEGLLSQLSCPVLQGYLCLFVAFVCCRLVCLYIVFLCCACLIVCCPEAQDA